MGWGSEKEKKEKEKVKIAGISRRYHCDRDQRYKTSS
jgi:bisphosphoglycerate-independent phosphoglycerate mutase (AlkP superfamily)